MAWARFAYAVIVVLSFALSFVQAQETVAQILAEIPLCALQCTFTELTAANCSFSDYHLLTDCVCRNETVQSRLSACVIAACSNTTEQKIAVTIEKKACLGYPIESRTEEIKNTAMVLSAVTFPIVMARMLSRYLTPGGIWWDDWIALSAAICLIPLNGIEIASSILGFGMHFWNLNLDNVAPLFKLFYSVQVVYVLVQDLAKLSILLLYLRVFQRNKFRIMVKLSIAFILAQCLTFCLLVIFQSTPMPAAWDRDVPGKFLNMPAIGYAGGALSIAEDLVILVMPIPELWTLTLEIKTRIGLCLLFGAGSFACVTSMIRLKYLVLFGNSPDLTWDNIEVVIWSMIEVNMALICACLPILRPLIIFVFTKLFRRRQDDSSLDGSSTTPPASKLQTFESKTSGNSSSDPSKRDNAYYEGIIGTQTIVESTTTPRDGRGTMPPPNIHTGTLTTIWSPTGKGYTANLVEIRKPRNFDVPRRSNVSTLGLVPPAHYRPEKDLPPLPSFNSAMLRKSGNSPV